MKRKNLNKAIVAWTLVMIMALIPVIGFAAAESTCGDGLTWSLTDGVLTISGSGDMADFASVNDTPWKDDRANITALVIEDGVTSIGANAFYACNNLKSVTIGKDLAVVADNAFYRCGNLGNVYGYEDVIAGLTIGENNTALTGAAYGYMLSGTCGDNLTYYYDGNETLTISGSGDMYNYVENIDGDLTDPAPWYDVAANINQVNLPDGITSIGDKAFANISAEEVTIPDSVKTIGLLAFDAADLKSVTIPGGVEDINISFAYTDIEELVLSEEITNIGWQDFFGCQALKEVYIPSTVTAISEKAFEECDAITDVYYNGTQAMWDDITIGDGNGSLMTADLHCAVEEDNNTCGDNLTWMLENGVLTISGSGDMTDFASVNDTPWKDDRTNITALVIEDGVTSIGANAFYACNNLKSVTIGKDLAVVADSAFYRCGNLAYVYGYEDVIADLTIGENNTALTGAEYGYMLSGSCGDNLTYYYDGKETLTISGTGVMYNYVENIDGELTDSAPWYDVAANIKQVNLPDGITLIGDYAFVNIAAEEIIIPDSVRVIGLLAFDAADLKSVTIPGGVEDINISFAYTDIEKLVLSEGITNIGWQDFFGCQALKEVHIPSTVTAISEKAFEECDAITDVYYNGIQAMWDDITIGDGNGSLMTAVLHINDNYNEDVEGLTVYADAFEMDGMAIVEMRLKNSNGRSKVVVGENEMLYNIERGVYVGVVTAEKLAGNKLTEINVYDEEPGVFVYGDVMADETVKISDLLIMKLYLAGKSTPEYAGMLAADLNGDGKISTGDVLAMKLYLTDGTPFPILK